MRNLFEILPLELIVIISNNIDIKILMEICGLTDDYICFAEKPPKNPLVILNEKRIREYWRGKNRYIFMNLTCDSFGKEDNEGQCRVLNNILKDLNYNELPPVFFRSLYHSVYHPIDTMIKNLWGRREMHRKNKEGEYYCYTTEFKCRLCEYIFNINTHAENADRTHIRKPYGWRMNDAGYCLSKIEAEIHDKKIQHFDSCHNEIPNNWENYWIDTLSEKKGDTAEKINNKIGVNFLRCKKCNWNLKYHYSESHDVYHWKKIGEKARWDDFDNETRICKGCKWNKNYEYNLLYNLYDSTIINQLELIKKTHRRVCGIQINPSLI
jgi:hypothetical protein